MEKILFFDLETTGVKFWKNGIHEIAAVMTVDNDIVDTFYSKVKPHENAIIEPEALAISGISEDDIKEYPEMALVYRNFVAFLEKHISKYNRVDKAFLAGYNNASFDNQFLRAWFIQMGDKYFGSWFWSSSIDAMILAANHLKARRKYMPNFKQGTVAKELGLLVDESKLHGALYDIEICMGIYNKVKG